MQSYFLANSRNTRKVWLGIKNIINIKNTSNFTQKHIVSKGVSFTDPKSIADRFNEFFTTIGNKVQNKVYSEHVNYDSYLNNPSQDSIFLRPTSTFDGSHMNN